MGTFERSFDLSLQSPITPDFVPRRFPSGFFVGLCAAAFVALAATPAAATFVYSQPSVESPMPFQSSQLGYDWQGNDYDQYVWDDFTLGAPASIVEVGWRGVYTAGGYWGGPVIDFLVSIWPSNPMVDAEPYVAGMPLVSYAAGSNAAETPPQPPGMISQSLHDYRFTLPVPFAASAGTHYWIQIEAIQAGATDWGIVAGSAGNGTSFGSHVNYAGGFQYWHLGADAAFTLADANSPHCGNAVVEAPEDCDDGSANGTPASCCSAVCVFEPATTVCNGGTCDGAGTCVPTPTTTTTTTTTTLPPVGGCAAAPQSGCLGGVKMALQIHEDASPSKNKLKWKIAKGDAFDISVLGNPIAARIYRICLYDERGAVPVLVASYAAAHASAWRPVGMSGYRYMDPDGTTDGIEDLMLKAGAAGKTQMGIKVHGVNAPMPVPFSTGALFAMNTGLTVQLVNDATPLCWSTRFPAASATRNDAQHFTAAIR